MLFSNHRLELVDVDLLPAAPVTVDRYDGFAVTTGFGLATQDISTACSCTDGECGINIHIRFVGTGTVAD